MKGVRRKENTFCIALHQGVPDADGVAEGSGFVAVKGKVWLALRSV